ncbi:MAG: hypothetical protein IPM51_10655 [Sphingobacteriaceae bacterium]|nr:hypothetical protein [Sphingobacteriaceae bacterium]
MTPEFPLISVYKDRGLNVFKDDSLFRKVTTYTLISQNPDENNFYDRYGKRWTFRFINDKIKNDFKTRLLANTIYNPMVSVDLDWKLNGSYDLSELKNAIFLCVDKDDDIITQFEEADIIKNAIRNCETFDDIVFALNKYVFEVDEQRLLKERGN